VLDAAVGPQICHEIEPLNESTPVTSTTVLSLTSTRASAGSAGIVVAGGCVLSVASTG
jgi:hypothetical protein